jgi:hypothetical protein
MKSLGAFLTVLCVLAFLSFAPSVCAEVYKWVDENGVVHYTERPPERDVQSQELAVQTTPGTRALDAETAEPERVTPWYEQWLVEQRERRLTEKQAREAASEDKGREQAQMLEKCVQARQRLKVLETPCRVFFDGRGVLRNWCRYETTYAYPGEFRFLEDDERQNMIRHYLKQAEECAAAGY